MNGYNEALNYLFTQLPMFQRTGPAAYKHSLGNSLLLDDLFGNPHKNYPTLHVAGTNGKGSVSHMLASVLQTCGYRTGLITSPHLKDFRERIKIDGKMIPEGYVANWVNKFVHKYSDLCPEPTFFELTIAMAFDYFATEAVDIAVVEVGLGGRLDSTNIITPEVSIITNISLDHTNLLGDSLQLIAAEKAGIIKPGVPVVIGQVQDETAAVFMQKAADCNAPVYFADKEYSASYSLSGIGDTQIFNFYLDGKLQYPELAIDLQGNYQIYNLPAVLKTVELLRASGWNISQENMYTGLRNVARLTGLQGRWQIIGANPRMVCDTGHNESGIRQIIRQIEQTPHDKLHMVFGMVSDKDIETILGILPRNALYYFCSADIPRALEANKLKELATAAGLHGEAYSSVASALESARNAASSNDFIFVGGSSFVVAEIL
jgi:dihydrofolate synthase/folylpolyglutamate synthase